MPLTSDYAKSDGLGSDILLPAAKEKSTTGPFRPSRVSAAQALEQVIGPISDEHPSMISKTRLGLASVALHSQSRSCHWSQGLDRRRRRFTACSIPLKACPTGPGPKPIPIPFSIPRAISMALPTKGALPSPELLSSWIRPARRLYFTASSGAMGNVPRTGLIRDAEGNLYGTTFWGGAYNQGTVFKLSETGRETVLHSFNKKDGEWPAAGLVMDEVGNLYGTTEYRNGYAGEVFKLDKTGREIVLYTFCARQNCADGAAPEASLIRDKEGNPYGTTLGGGNAPNCFDCGVVFRLDAKRKETVLHAFTGQPDRQWPVAGLVHHAAGNLYGTTPVGGTACTEANYYGCGVVFKLDKAGRETFLHRFRGTGGDGASPSAGLVLDSSGNLYGTTHA
jgi:uncharacterized repeat protein (TIGR03803 family)